MAEGKRLAGKVALVTGGSRGIGRGICLAFGREGADVAVNYVSRPDAAEEVVVQLRQMGRGAIAVRADVSRGDQVEAMFHRIISEFGRVDILVNNAGLQVWVPAVDMTEEQWGQTINVDLKGTFLCSRLAARQMIKQGRGGTIINITSVQAEVVVPRHVNYAAAKAGLAHFTRALAVELAPYKINVNAVGPGAIDTDMNQFLRDDLERRARVIAKIPWGRIGTPEDLAPLAVFLASAEADYITGQNIYVDGGLMLL